MHEKSTTVCRKYSHARPRIHDGDLIVLRSSGSMLAKLTNLLLTTPYTHTSIALWLEGGLWAAEMGASGNMLVPLSQYRHTPFDAFPCPAPRAAVRRLLLEHLRDHTPYDFRDLFLIWANRALGARLRSNDGEMVCSQFSAHVYLEAGWKPSPKLPAVAAPDDVVGAMRGPPHVRYCPSTKD